MTILFRQLSKKLEEALKLSPVVLINGPVQAGKSTVTQQVVSKMGEEFHTIHHSNLNFPSIRLLATNEPHQFIKERNGKMIIDAVELAPELFRVMKLAVDRDRITDKTKAAGRFIITSSSPIQALPQLADALVGRMSIFTLYPLCTAEAIQTACEGLTRILSMNFKDMKDHGLDLVDAISKSTYPEVASLPPFRRNLWFDDYLTTILQRDVRQLAELDKISALPNLLRLLATRAGSLLNDSEIARDLGMSSVTSKQYRNILKMMFLNFDIQPWYRNIGKRLVKAPKGYLTDTLMLAYMLGLDLRDMQHNRPELFGHALENYVATELIKQISFSDVKAQLLHFRTSDGKEVDFVIEKQDGSIFAIEIKKSESVNIQDFKGIQLLAELAPKDFVGGIVLYSGKEAVPFGKNLWAVPFHVLWQ